MCLPHEEDAVLWRNDNSPERSTRSSRSDGRMQPAALAAGMKTRTKLRRDREKLKHPLRFGSLFA